jgi:hypothetical protein
MKRTTIVAVSFLLLAGLIACSDSDVLGPGTGDLNVYLTDAPINLDNVTAVNVTIAEMIAFPACGDSDAGCPGVALGLIPAEGSDEVTLNLLDYRDGQVILMASEEVPVGDYKKIRMEITRASLLEDDDQNPDTPDVMEEIFLPSGKVDVVVPFVISAGEETEIVLDFDAALSVHLNETGNEKYILRPVINGSQG